jgi:hypothetical protein
MTAAKRFKLTPPAAPSEYETHCAVADMLAICLQPPAWFSTFPAFGYARLTPRQAAKLSRLHVQAGVCDILLWYQSATYGIEIKRAGTGRLSRDRAVRTRRGSLRIVPGQVETHERMTQAGVRVAVCTSVDDVMAALRCWQIPVRGNVQAMHPKPTA